MTLHIPEEFPCPLCDCPTQGHAVPDESSTLCRDCFLTWIARGEGIELEERIVSIEAAISLEAAKPLADAMRKLHAKHLAEASTAQRSMSMCMCAPCWRRAVRALEQSLRKSIAYTSELVQGSGNATKDGAEERGISRESLAHYRGRWTP